jgi:trimeric autotransporter adhesin
VIGHRAILLLACGSLFGQSYTISTIAGGGTAGTSLNNPTSIAVDIAGNVYVGDWSGSIRKIWALDGGISTVAGTGNLGYSGDGGQATNAMLGKTGGIAIDNAGNIYLADTDNNRIRRVDVSTGIITTIAGTGAPAENGDGGPATNAGVSRPSGIALDSAGNVYFGSGWDRVRKVMADTGVISTVAGKFGTSFGGDKGPALSAHFWDPIPGAVDRSGDIYIADFENSRIRKMGAATGFVDTVAGSAPCSSGPFGVTVCRGEYAGDGGPATSSRLNYASAVAVDIDGNLYIADTQNHRIRRVDASSGFISTIAGVGTSGFSGDGGAALAAEITTPVAIAIDYTGNVYFADEGNGRIRVLTPATPQRYALRRIPRPLLTRRPVASP